jgi:anti-anti-sigma factor
MRRHLTTSAIGNKTRNEGKTAERTRITRRAPAGQTNHTQPGAGRPSLSLAPASVWTHTLVLAGELDLRSARTLEAEVERLCEEGVTRIILDLRELARIDAIGVAVVAFRCGHCTRHGYEFGLIPGSPSIQRAFEEAGVIDSLPFLSGETADASEPALAGHDGGAGGERQAEAKLAQGDPAAVSEQRG